MAPFPDAPMRGPARTLATMVLIAACYFAAARLGLILASIHGTVSPVWPATGVAIGALALGGRRMWPAIFFGALLVNLPGPIAWYTALAISLGNTGEAIAGAWIIGRVRAWGFRPALLGDVAGCGLAALGAPMISASVGVTALWLGGSVSEAMMQNVARTWWVGDALGTLTITPLLLAVAARKADPRATLRGLMVVGLVAGVVAAWVFFQATGGAMLFILFPVLIGSVVVAGRLGVSLATVVIATAGIVAGFFGHGPFVGGSLNDNLLFLQVFLISISIAAMVLPIFAQLGGLHVAGVVLLVGWSVSGWIFGHLQRERITSDRARFEAMADGAELAIRQRMATYLEALRAGAALFAASDLVGRTEWKVFVDTLALQTRLPGMRGLGMVSRVHEHDLDAFVRAQRLDGAPDFTPGTVPGATGVPGGDRYIITYVEPQVRNPTRAGLDVGSEANRRQAAEEARDAGEPRASARIRLVDDEPGLHGFLVFHPVYRAGGPIGTVQERRAAFERWVFAPFGTAEFLEAAFQSEELELAVFDGRSLDPEAQVYRSRNESTRRTGFEKTVVIELAGNLFTLGWNRGAAFSEASPSAAVLTATSLALVSLLIAGLVMSLQSTGRQAREIAAARTAELTATQASLAEINRLQRAVLDGTVYSIVATELDGTIRVFNGGAERMLGYRREEMIGRETPAIIHLPEEVVARAAELSAELGRRIEPGFEAFVVRAAQGEVEQREWTYLRKDGSRVPVLLSVTALRNDTGAITGYLGIAHDLTERRALEQTLQLEQSRLRLANSAAGIAVWEWDVDSGALRWDAAMLELYGLPLTAVDHVSYEMWRDMVHPDDLPGQETTLQEMIRTAGRSQREFRIIRVSDGEIRHISGSDLAITGAGGRTVRVVGVNRDITVRRRAMEQLRQSQARLASIFGAVREGLVLQDADGRVLECNAAACLLLGLSREQMDRRAPMDPDWQALHEDGSTYPGFDHPSLDTLRTGQPVRDAIMGVRKGTGAPRWISMNTVPIRDPAGVVQAVVCSFSDVSAQRQIARDMVRARDDAMEASRLKSEFLATMSHEIRTPMNGIIGTIELLLGSPLDPTQGELARLVQASADNLLEIINDILDFSRIEAGKFRLNPEPFEALGLLEDTATLLAARAQRKGLELVLDVEPSLASEVLVGDAGRLRQVLLNIIGNAVKFTERGEVVLRARVIPEPDGRGLLRLSVRDTGIGIAPEARGRLFEAFSQIDSSATRRYGGTGLGLAISRQLVELMGGALDFTSVLGHGSEFFFEIGLTRQGGGAIPGACDGMDVLVVDDNATARETLVRQLEQIGTTAEGVAGAAEALTWLEASSPEHGRRRIVLVDRVMPVMDGGRLIRSIREKFPTSEVGLIMLCPTGGAGVGEGLEGQGVAAVLGKPVRIGQLRLALIRARAGRDSPEPFSPAGAQPAMSPGSSAKRPALRVLLVEDNPANQLVARMVLENLGHTVDVADNGRIALERLAQVKYDVVFMDCQMPELDGYEATRQIRSRLLPGVDPGQRIIALTAFAMETDKLKCRNAGMDDYVSKPVRAREVRDVLDRCLGPAAVAGPPTGGGATAEPTPDAASEVGDQPELLLDDELLDTLRSLPGRSGPSLLTEVMVLYAHEMDTKLDELTAATTTRRFDDVMRMAHTLAGSSAAAGSPRAQKALASIEQAARAGVPTKVEARIALARRVWLELRAELVRRDFLLP